MKKLLLLALLLMPWLAQADPLTAIGYGKGFEMLLPAFYGLLALSILVGLLEMVKHKETPSKPRK